jgi:hypothetical protein
MISSVYNRIGGKSHVIGRSTIGKPIYDEVPKGTAPIRINLAHAPILNPCLEARYQDDADERARRGLHREKPQVTPERTRYVAVDSATIAADTLRQSLRHIVVSTVNTPGIKRQRSALGVNQVDADNVLRPITAVLDVPDQRGLPKLMAPMVLGVPKVATVEPRRAIGR